MDIAGIGEVAAVAVEAGEDSVAEETTELCGNRMMVVLKGKCVGRRRRGVCRGR